MGISYYDGITLEMDTTIEFGDHQGLTVAEVLEGAPDYIEWMIDQGMSFDEEVLNSLS